ncbi:MAG: TonB-dependent receptor [Bryobacterales bacterium]|nr:TonB-dependent receptor [Bryobacterales bacterium]
MLEGIMTAVQKFATGVCVVLVFASAAFGQTERGTIRGIVLDTSGAAIGDVTVTATHVDTGVVTETISTPAGVYQIPQVRPGTYTVEAEFAGFKRFVRENVRVATAAIVPLELVMEVGAVTENVTVSATAITLKTESTEVSTEVNPKSYVELPLQVVGGSGRAVESFIFLAPGTTGDTFNAHINGSQTLSKEIQMDGLSMSTAEVGGDPRVILLPPEAVQEFSLVTNNFSAEYGNTGGGIERLVVRSGTNDFHGNAYWFVRNDKLDASGFFAATRPVQRRNEYGASIGGPIKRNRAFFFTNWHWYKFRGGALNATGSVPTPQMRSGDFSELIPAGEGVIYDPLTERRVGGATVRDPFSQNSVPASRHSAISNRIWDLVPLPDSDGIFNNIFAQGNQQNNNRNNTIKLDYNLTSAHRLSTMYTFGQNTDNGPFAVLPQPVTDARSGARGPVANNGRINYDWIISPTMLFHGAAGISRQDQLLVNLETEGAGWAEQLGIRGTHNGPFPVVLVDPWNSYARHQRKLPTISTTFLYSPSLSWTKGRHSLKFGAEIRKLQNNFTLGPDSGSFSFSRNATALPGETGTGNVLASYLLGLVNRGTLNIPPVTGTRHSYYAFYVQDDFKVRPNLTLNLGLRYDIFTPLTEVNDNHSMMNPTLPNPRADGYPGALEFAGDCDVCTGRSRLTGNDSIYPKNFGPRFGLAYSISNKLVFRSAYAISFFPTGGQGGGNVKAPSLGFSSTGTFQSEDGGFTPGFSWEDGFPQDFQRPPLRDPSFANGQSPSFWFPGANRPQYTQSYNAGFQYQLAPTWLLDVAWVANKATRLSSGVTNVMQVHPRHLALGDLLRANINDPRVAAAGIAKPYASFGGTVAQSLRLFPQFAGTAHWGTWPAYGNSTYHALQVKVEKEFTEGLWLLSSYTWQKTLTDSSSSLGNFFGSSARDEYNRSLEKGLAIFDVPQRVVAAFNYELPFGNGKAIGGSAGGILQKIIGGWQLNAIVSYQGGTPVVVSQNNTSPLFVSKQMPNAVSGASPERDRGGFDPGAADKALNLAAFDETGSFDFGNAGAVLPNARNFSTFNEDFGLMKRIFFNEDVNVEFRFEVFNAFNRVIFGNPAANVSNPAGFGTVGSQANQPRQGQFGLKISF